MLFRSIDKRIIIDKSNTCLFSCTLKYVTLYYTYKILRIASKHIKLSFKTHNPITFLKHTGEQQCCILGNIMENYKTTEPLALSIKLNETSLLIKLNIIGIICFLEEIDVTSAFNNLQNYGKKSLFTPILNGIFLDIKGEEDIKDLTILNPKDMVSMILKSFLLLRLRLYDINNATKQDIVLFSHMNPILKDLSAGFKYECEMGNLILKLYLIQFVNQWSVMELKQVNKEYYKDIIEIMNKVEIEIYDTPLISMLKQKIFEECLNLYIKLSIVNCVPFIESALENIKKSRYINSVHILSSIFTRKIITIEDLRRIREGDFTLSNQYFSSVINFPEVNIFIDKKGLETLAAIYIDNINDSNAITISNFILNLILIPQITKHFLDEPCFDKEVYYTILINPEGQRFFLRLVEIVFNHIQYRTKNVENTYRFFEIVMDVLMKIKELKMSAKEEKQMILALSLLLSSLLSTKNVLLNHILEHGKKYCKRNGKTERINKFLHRYMGEWKLQKRFRCLYYAHPFNKGT